MRRMAWAKWPLLIAGFVVLVLACVLVFPGLLVDRALGPGQQLVAAERAKAENDVRTTLLQGVAGLLLLAGAIATWRQLQVSRGQLQHNLEASRQELHLSREAQITERFTKAIDQLDYAKSLEVRLGAIYALERIARDSERDHWPIMEVLTAYVRQHAPWPPKKSEPPGESVEPEERSAMAFPAFLRYRKPAPDIQAILTVVGRRTLTYGQGEDQPLNLSATDLRGAHLKEAHLEGAHLWGAHLQNANLERAHLDGANFWGANLAEANFREAHLERADFEGALLERAHFSGAHLKGAVFEGARAGGAYLADAHLEGANLPLIITDEHTQLPASLAHLIYPRRGREESR